MGKAPVGSPGASYASEAQNKEVLHGDDSPIAADNRQSVAERILAPHRQRWTGKHNAHALGLSPAPISQVLKRAGLLPPDIQNRVTTLIPTPSNLSIAMSAAGASLSEIRLPISRCGESFPAEIISSIGL